MDSKYFLRRSDCSCHDLFPGVQLFTATGRQMTLSYVEFQPHAVVERHQHPHEQMGILLEGELTFEIGDEVQLLGPGDMWRIPGGVPHKATAGPAPVRALDVFHPVRDDYR